jgi:hypothetical protein
MYMGSVCPPTKTEMGPLHLVGNRSRGAWTGRPGPSGPVGAYHTALAYQALKVACAETSRPKPRVAS